MLPDQGYKAYRWYDKNGTAMQLLRAFPNKYDAYAKADELIRGGIFGVRVRRYTITVPGTKVPNKMVTLTYWGVYTADNQYGSMLTGQRPMMTGPLFRQRF